MVRISILYPHAEGARFDVAYYLDTHMPLALERLGAACRGVSVETGISGALPDTPPAYAVQCHFLFDTAQAFYDAFLPHMAELQGDIPNYTDIEPIIQFSQVRLFKAA